MMAGCSRSCKKARNISGLQNQKPRPSLDPKEVELVDEDDDYGLNWNPYTERSELKLVQEDVDDNIDGGYTDGILTAEIFMEKFEEQLVRIAAELDDPLSNDEWLPPKERAKIRWQKKERKGV